MWEESYDREMEATTVRWKLGPWDESYYERLKIQEDKSKDPKTRASNLASLNRTIIDFPAAYSGAIMADWSKAKDLIIGALSEVKKMSDSCTPAGPSSKYASNFAEVLSHQ